MTHVALNRLYITENASWEDETSSPDIYECNEACIINEPLQAL